MKRELFPLLHYRGDIDDEDVFLPGEGMHENIICVLKEQGFDVRYQASVRSV
jgi:hypothetical protein